MDNKSKDAFQSSIRTELRKAGIVRNVTTELRRQICQTLNQSHKRQIDRKVVGYNLEQAAIRSLVMEYLLCDELENTACVFSSESCLDEHILSRADALKSYSIAANSSIHSILTRINGNNDQSSCYENSCIHILLTHAAQLSKDTRKHNISTQTKPIEDNFTARKHLDRQLELINEKFKSSTSIMCDKRQIEDKMEAKLQSIQKECEKLAKIEMERKLKKYHETTLLSIRREEEVRRQQDILQMQLDLKGEYEAKQRVLLERERDAKKDYYKKEIRLESKLIEAQKKLNSQTERLKEEEKRMKDDLELERKKLKIEEDRLKVLSTTVEAKLEFAEKKEISIRKHIESEYERIRSTARRTFDDASETIRQQTDMYSKEFIELNSYRKSLSDTLAKNDQIEGLRSDIQKEKNNLIEEIEVLQDKLVATTKHLEKKENECLSAVQQNEAMKEKVLGYESNLANLQERELAKQAAHTQQKEEYASLLKDARHKLSQTKCALKKLTEENCTLQAELGEMRKLFQRSQEALICKTQTKSGSFDQDLQIRKHISNCGSFSPPQIDRYTHFDANVMKWKALERVDETDSKNVKLPYGSVAMENEQNTNVDIHDNNICPDYGQELGDDNDIMSIQSDGPNRSSVSCKQAPKCNKQQIHTLENHNAVLDHHNNINISQRRVSSKRSLIGTCQEITLDHDVVQAHSNELESAQQCVQLVNIKEASNKSFISDITFCNAFRKEEKGGHNEGNEMNLFKQQPENSQSEQTADRKNDTDVDKESLLQGKQSDSKYTSKVISDQFKRANFSHCSVNDEGVGEGKKIDYDKGETSQDKTNEYDQSDFESESNIQLQLDDGGDEGKIFKEPTVDGGDDIPELPSSSEMNEIKNMQTSMLEEESGSLSKHGYDEAYGDSFELEEPLLKDDGSTDPGVKQEIHSNNESNGGSLSIETGGSSSQFESSASAGIQVYTSSNRTNIDW